MSDPEGQPSPPLSSIETGLPQIRPLQTEHRSGRESPDLPTRMLEEDLRERKAQADQAEIAAQTARWNLRYRLAFAPVMLVMACAWLCFVAFMIRHQGLSAGAATTQKAGEAEFFKLSDSVMIALISTTTINVLSLLAAVIAYLFWRNQSNVAKP